VCNRQNKRGSSGVGQFASCAGLTRPLAQLPTPRRLLSAGDSRQVANEVEVRGASFAASRLRAAESAREIRARAAHTHAHPAHSAPHLLTPSCSKRHREQAGAGSAKGGLACRRQGDFSTFRLLRLHSAHMHARSPPAPRHVVPCGHTANGIARERWPAPWRARRVVSGLIT
jgi:hypothetical protein